jgi:hypothetical protein
MFKFASFHIQFGQICQLVVPLLQKKKQSLISWVTKTPNLSFYQNLHPFGRFVGRKFAHCHPVPHSIMQRQEQILSLGGHGHKASVLRTGTRKLLQKY